MSRQEFDYRMSGRKRWSACPGSVALAARAPVMQFDSEYAEGGTNAHAYLEAWLRWYQNGQNEIDAALKESAASKLDADEIKAVHVCIDHVLEILDSYADAVLLVETQLSVDITHITTKTCGGTCDIRIWVPSLSLMYVIDYKHGAGVAVEVNGNKQLRGYALGAREEHQADTYILQIVQPRCFHKDGYLRQEMLSAADMDAEEVVLYDEIVRCEFQDNQLLVPYGNQGVDAGEINYCRWCPAAITCPALEAKALAATGTVDIRTMRGADLVEPTSLPLDRVSYIMQAAPAIRAWLNAVEEYGENAALAGYHVPGFKLVESSTRRVYAKAPEEIAEDAVMLLGCNLDDVYPRKLINITDMEKLFVDTFKRYAKRGMKKAKAEEARAIFAWLTTKTGSGKPTLAPDSDKRPRWSDRATKAFAAVQLPPPEDGEDE